MQAGVTSKCSAIHATFFPAASFSLISLTLSEDSLPASRLRRWLDRAAKRAEPQPGGCFVAGDFDFAAPHLCLAGAIQALIAQ